MISFAEETSNRINVTHVIPFLGIAQGGPVHALAHQLKHQADIYNISIHASPTVHDGTRAKFPNNIRINAHLVRNTVGFRFCPKLHLDLKREAKYVDILHSHLMWTDAHRHAAAIARHNRVPHIISPCGTLNKDAMAYRSYKKRPVAWAFQNRALKDATCIHVKSENELESVRSYGIKTPVAVIPNMISYPGPSDTNAISSYRNKFKLSKNKKRLLYLGRIHPVKGLRRLIQTWSMLSQYHKDWELVIAGPDEGNFQKTIEADIEAKNLDSTVHFTGMLQNGEKWAALHEASLFTLPSDFENFGSAVAEAAMADTPIIATQGTPWKCLNEHKAGWWVESNVEALKAAFEEAFSMPTEALIETGTRAKTLAVNSTPEKVCQKWDQLYNWLLDREDTPEFIQKELV